MSTTVHVDLASMATAAAMGTGATLLMDAWNVVLRRVAGIRSLDYCLLGRWVLHMPGVFRHASITTATRRPHECPVGWLVHYSIGVSLAVTFVLLASEGWLRTPTLPVALAYGLVTLVFPLFVLQPALGLGIASSKTAKPMRARVKSVGTHLVFGLGLYLSGVGCAWIRTWG